MKVWGCHFMWRSAEPVCRPGWRPTASGVWLVCLGFCRGLSGRFFVGVCLVCVSGCGVVRGGVPIFIVVSSFPPPPQPTQPPPELPHPLGTGCRASAPGSRQKGRLPAGVGRLGVGSWLLMFFDQLCCCWCLTVLLFTSLSS